MDKPIMDAPDREMREAELRSLMQDEGIDGKMEVVERYKRLRGIPEVLDASTGASADEMIQALLDAEFPRKV